MDQDRLAADIKKLGPWFHQIEIAPGVRTRDIAPSPGPQPVDHPASRWQIFKDRIPSDLSGTRVLDIGCADGFFTVELARRGANVVAQDAWKKMIDRLEWVVEHLGLTDRVTCRVGEVETLSTEERYDFVLCLGLIYHLRHPFWGLERMAQLSDTMYVESTIDLGDKPYLYLKPPVPGVHNIPKWFPTESCIEEMLKFVGFSNVENLNDPTHRRASFVATR